MSPRSHSLSLAFFLSFFIVSFHILSLSLFNFLPYFFLVLISQLFHSSLHIAFISLFLSFSFSDFLYSQNNPKICGPLSRCSFLFSLLILSLFCHIFHFCLVLRPHSFLSTLILHFPSPGNYLSSSSCLLHNTHSFLSIPVLLQVLIYFHLSSCFPRDIIFSSYVFLSVLVIFTLFRHLFHSVCFPLPAILNYSLVPVPVVFSLFFMYILSFLQSSASTTSSFFSSLLISRHVRIFDPFLSLPHRPVIYLFFSHFPLPPSLLQM